MTEQTSLRICRWTNICLMCKSSKKKTTKTLNFSSSGASGTTKTDTKSRKNDDDDDDDNDDDDDEILGESLGSLPPIYYVGALILGLVALVCMIRYCMKRFKNIFFLLQKSSKLGILCQKDMTHLLHRTIIYMTMCHTALSSMHPNHPLISYFNLLQLRTKRAR